MKLTDYLEICSKEFVFDRTRMEQHCRNTILYYSNKAKAPKATAILQKAWYASIRKNNDNPLYEVYEDTHFIIADLFACYHVYSKKYVRELVKHKDVFKGLKSVVDLGGGTALATADLKQLFKTVCCTNIKDSRQFKVARHIVDKDELATFEDIGKFDVVFASEYFEHIEDPIKHLEDVIYKCKPKIMVIANAFNTYSIGHFTNYNGVPQEKISRLFNNTLRRHGYTNIKLGIWNNRPNIWIK